MRTLARLQGLNIVPEQTQSLKLVRMGASDGWWSGDKGLVFPEVVAVLVEVLSPEGSHGCGSVNRPVHAKPFQSLPDRCFAVDSIIPVPAHRQHKSSP